MLHEIEHSSVQVDCDFAVIWQGIHSQSTDTPKRLWVEVSDKIVYSTTAKRWAIGVPTVRWPSKPTMDYVHSQRPKELQLWPVFVGYVVLVVSKGGIWGREWGHLQVGLSPCVLRVLGSCPVLVFRLTQTSTCSWAWKLLISTYRMEKLSSLKYEDSTRGRGYR